METYWLPTRPYGVIDAINRHALATGSMRFAQIAADADYNGHYVTVAFNDYRGYWVTEYTWAGRNVLARGEFARCLEAGIEEYNRGALGATLVVCPRTEEEAALCRAKGLVVKNEEEHYKTWWTPLHMKVGEAFLYQQQTGIPVPAFLANSKSVEEYEAKVKEALAARNLAAKA